MTKAKQIKLGKLNEITDYVRDDVISKVRTKTLDKVEDDIADVIRQGTVDQITRSARIYNPPSNVLWNFTKLYKQVLDLSSHSLQ